MILYGLLDSPFARRIAVTMEMYGISFERRALSVFRDFDAMLGIHPLGKAPSLQLHDGTILVESQIIAEHLDDLAGEGASLLPKAPAVRTAMRSALGIAIALAEKNIALRIERAREGRGTGDPEWLARLPRQVSGALAALESRLDGRNWLAGDVMTHADIAAAIAWTDGSNKIADMLPADRYPRLAALNARCEALPAFRAWPFMNG